MRAPQRNGSSQTTGENIEDEPGASCKPLGSAQNLPALMAVCQRVQEPTGKAPNDHSKNNLNKINNTVLDYNLKYKINIHEYMYIDIND